MDSELMNVSFGNQNDIDKDNIYCVRCKEDTYYIAYEKYSDIYLGVFDESIVFWQSNSFVRIDFKNNDLYIEYSPIKIENIKIKNRELFVLSKKKWQVISHKQK